MPKPTEQELDVAIKMAIQMRENDLDPFNVARCLLSHNYRIKYLEQVMSAADRYLNMGMSEQERARLQHALRKASELESYTSQDDKEDFGLE